MQYCCYKKNKLYFEDTSLLSLAEEFGTPCYVYSKAAITQSFKEYTNAFGSRSHLICFAVKANSNIAILNLLSKLGSGFDIVSGGELQRVIAAGGDPKKVVFLDTLLSNKTTNFLENLALASIF